MQLLLNHFASVAKGSLACWWLVADVGPVQSVLLLQQLGDFFIVLIEPVLVFELGEAKGLIGCCIHGVAERGPAVFHIICDLDVLCALLHCVGQLSTYWRPVQFRDVKSLWCWLSLVLLLLENSDLHLGDDQWMISPAVSATHGLGHSNILPVPLPDDDVVYQILCSLAHSRRSVAGSSLIELTLLSKACLA